MYATLFHSYKVEQYLCNRETVVEITIKTITTLLELELVVLRTIYCLIISIKNSHSHWALMPEMLMVTNVEEE